LAKDTSVQPSTKGVLLTPNDYLFLLHYGMGFMIGLVLVPLIIADLWDTKTQYAARPYTRTSMNFIFVIVLAAMVIQSIWPFATVDLDTYDYYDRGYGWDLPLYWAVAGLILTVQIVAIPTAGYLAFKRFEWLSHQSRSLSVLEYTTEPMRHARVRRGIIRR
jgi:hypothetical protein